MGVSLTSSSRVLASTAIVLQTRLGNTQTARIPSGPGLGAPFVLNSSHVSRPCSPPFPQMFSLSKTRTSRLDQSTHSPSPWTKPSAAGGEP